MLETIEVLICTTDKGICNVSLCLNPEEEGVTYLISCQYLGAETPQVPEALSIRKDVRVIFLAGRGLSKNRNNAFLHAKGDILVIADDDLRYFSDSFENIRKTFTENPKIDLALFKSVTPNNKLFPNKRFQYPNTPKGYFVSSYEIALRKGKSFPPFDERFGLGAPYMVCGEEEVFVEQSSRRGLRVEYFPINIVSTSNKGTGSKLLTNKGVQRAKGGTLYIMHGFVGAWLRCLKCAISMRSKINPFKFLATMTEGIIYAMKK